MSEHMSLHNDSSRHETERRVSGSSERTMNFFHRVLQRRDDLYASDAAPHEISTRSHLTTVSDLSNRWMMRNPSNRISEGVDVPPFPQAAAEVQDSDDHRDSDESQRCQGSCEEALLCNCSDIETRIWAVIQSKTWNAFLTIATLTLFFGPEMRTLVFDKSADSALDVVFTVVFCIFVADMMMRVMVEPHYFSVQTWLSQSRDNDNVRDNSCKFGSFVFWCELLSTIALLREIEYVNRAHFSEIQIDISLNRLGVPISGLGDVNWALPIEVHEYNLLAVVFRTARIARFLRSEAAERLAARFGWNWMLNPFGLWRSCRHNAHKDGMVSHDNDVPMAQTRTGMGVAADRGATVQNSDRDSAVLQENTVPMAQTQTGLGGSADRDDVVQPSDPDAETSVDAFAGGNQSSQSNPGSQRREVKVGATMRERTGQRVALGIMLTLIVTMLFTYRENDATMPTTMIVLHTDTSFANFANQSLDSARERAVPELFKYQFRDGSIRMFEVDGEDINSLRPREIVQITISENDSREETSGSFAFRREQREIAMISVLATFFILCMWFFGVTAFVGPVMMLVVIPIERMVKLLRMLKRNPLGYQSQSTYKKFISEENTITKNTRWTKEILKGMETSFLMSTILRIGNLLKVGFGSAGAEIIQKNLEKGQAKNMLDLHSKGSTVSCIFLFCDIRQFTDATECLQEEVFVFTNRIAAVVHSICNAYGGSANKNIGDAFLLSWSLDDCNNLGSSVNAVVDGTAKRAGDTIGGESFAAKTDQADKALLSVIKISIALYYDSYYIEPMSDNARQSLLAKLSNREGPVVQMGFGLHAGSAVQGAIGSQRKIDATYVSEAVERAEFLESSTKKYGVPMLMSDSFHRLLTPKTRGRCRKIDQIKILNEDEDADDDDIVYDMYGGLIELFTFDMDIPAFFRKHQANDVDLDSESNPTDRSSFQVGMTSSNRPTQNSSRHGNTSVRRRNKFLALIDGAGSEEMSESNNHRDDPHYHSASAGPPTQRDGDPSTQRLVLPTGPTLYNASGSVWTQGFMKVIRERYSDGIFFQAFNSGLQAFYAKDWETSRANFASILDRFEDGPSRYFYDQIWDAENERLKQPPRKFRAYGTA